MNKVYGILVRGGLVILAALCIGYLCGSIASGISVSESVDINGSGTLFTMTTSPHGKDRAAGMGTQSYARDLELDLGSGNSTLATYYKLDADTPYFHNGYFISVNNKKVGVQHSVNVYNSENIETENFIGSDSAALTTDFGVLGTGTLRASVLVADGHHATDLVRTFADGDFEYISSVYEMDPPAGGDGDWLACGQLVDCDWPAWLDDEDDDTDEGCIADE